MLFSLDRNSISITVLIAFQLIFGTNSGSVLTQFCDTEIVVQVATPVWFGNIKIHPTIRSSGIDLNLLFEETNNNNTAIDIRGGFTELILKGEEILNLQLNAVVDEEFADNPSLKEIQLNGQSVCTGVSGVIVDVEKPVNQEDVVEENIKNFYNQVEVSKS